MPGDELPNARYTQKGTWYWIDKLIIQRYASQVGALGIAVYNCLASFANAEQTCYPSQDRIARMLCCSRTTVNRAIRSLETAGLITVERRGRYPQLYRLLDVRCITSARLMSTKGAFDVASAHTNKNKNKQN